jgi:hypothetical protein
MLSGGALRDYHPLAAALRHRKANRLLPWHAHPVHHRALFPLPLAVRCDLLRLIGCQDVFRERRLGAVVTP